MSAAVRAVLSTIPYDILGPEQVNGQWHLRRPKYDEWERILFEEYRRERSELAYSLRTWGTPWISSNRERVPIPRTTSPDAWARFMAWVIVSRCVFPPEEYERDQRHTLRSEFADALVPGHNRLLKERQDMNKARAWPTSFEDLAREDEEDEDSDPLDRLALEARAFLEPSSVEAMVERRALRKLSAQDRAVLVLRTAFKRHPGHLAHVSGWTPEAARKRVQRARARLQAETEAEWAWGSVLLNTEEVIDEAMRAEGWHLSTSPPSPKPKAWNRPSLQSEVQDLIAANGSPYKLSSADRLTLRQTRREVLDDLDRWLHHIPTVPPGAYQTYSVKDMSPVGFGPEDLLMFGPYLYYRKDEMTLDTSRNGSGETLTFEGWEISRFRAYPNGRSELWWRADNGGLRPVYAPTPKLLLEGMRARQRSVTFS